MFTGIVEEMGVVQKVGPSRLTIGAAKVLQGLKVSHSIAVNGACLTVVAREGGAFSVDVIPETLRRTNLGLLREGERVNLERPLALGERFGGHFVQGHIDATGQVVSITREGDSWLVTFEAPGELMRYVVEKGFIAVDGVSLTVVQRTPASFTVALIPYTREHTTLGLRKPGDKVNLEADILAKYVESLAPWWASKGVL